MADTDDDAAKKRVQEAVWTWTGRVMVLLVVFIFGMFAGWVQWGGGDQGAVALRARTVDLDARLLECKNKQVDIDGKLTVVQSRYDECQKALQKAHATP